MYARLLNVTCFTRYITRYI